MGKIILICLLAATISGCSSIAGGTNTLSDEKIKAHTSGVLGYTPNQITITSKQVQGTNTYVNLKASDKKEFTCVINGGNIFTLGMVNPPSCARKGQAINSNPFQK